MKQYDPTSKVVNFGRYHMNVSFLDSLVHGELTHPTGTVWTYGHDSKPNATFEELVRCARDVTDDESRENLKNILAVD